MEITKKKKIKQEGQIFDYRKGSRAPAITYFTKISILNTHIYPLPNENATTNINICASKVASYVENIGTKKTIFSFNK